MEINPLITFNDLGVGLASNQNSYFCLDAGRPAVKFGENNNVWFSTFNVTPATTKNFPVSPDILNNVNQSCNLERRKLDIITTDPCSIGSSHQNLSLSNTASNLEAPIMTDTLDQEKSIFNNKDLSSCGMKRQDPAINTDPCSIGSSHQNVSRSSTSSNLEAPTTTDTLHQEEPLLTNEDPSCSSERREPQVPTDLCSSAQDKSTKRVYPKKSCPGRKRQRDPKNWKMNKLKTLRNLGLEYTNKKEN
ncbi:unnamed protein product [Arctia plantaginis]|uniref:Uncharacterized protein n=1 Tax=Arctia plantaginis TaxID=874455 RepID=A0A8S1AYR3_ARCPL|nr:unnamed protein product [Arctia plantaginis]